ncbi:MAG: hypothetical protein ACXAD7_09725 [Candidatus Kariarchaeaceae archaeon]|jgi:hypothetical protein
MSKIMDFVDRYARPIIFTQTFLLVFFVVACTLNDYIPVCHYIFGCDHRMPDHN